MSLSKEAEAALDEVLKESANQIFESSWLYLELTDPMAPYRDYRTGMRAIWFLKEHIGRNLCGWSIQDWRGRRILRRVIRGFSA